MKILRYLPAVFLCCIISAASAQIRFVNATQADVTSNHLHTCSTNIIRLEGLPRGAQAILKHTDIKFVDQTIYINSPAHDHGEADTLQIISAANDLLLSKVFVYDTCFADRTQGAYWWNKKLFFANVTNKGVLQGDYHDFFLPLPLATVRANPILRINDAGYRISRVVIMMGCPTCDFGMPVAFSSGDLSSVLRNLQLRGRCTRFSLSEIQCTNIHNPQDVKTLSDIYVLVK